MSQYKSKLMKGFVEISSEYHSVPRKEVFKELWKNAKPQKRSLFFLIVLMISQGGVVAGSIWLVKTAIDYFFAENNLKGVFFLISALFLATVIKSVLNFLFNWIKLLAITRIRDGLVVKAFRNLLFNPFGLHINERDRKKYGWVLSDAAKFVSSFFDMFNSWVKQPFILLSTIAALMVIAPYLTLIGIIITPMGVPVVVTLKRKLKHYIAERKMLLGLQEEIVAETIRNIRIIKIFGLEKNVTHKLKQAVDQQRMVNQKNAFFLGLMPPISEMLGLMGLSLIIFIGSKNILSSTFTTGTFFVFIMSFLDVYRPIKDISNGFLNFHLMLDSGSRLIRLERNAQRESHKSKTCKIEHFKNISCQNLWFSYIDKPTKDTDYVLRDLSLTIEQGENVALVGATGAGKSTLCDIIFNLYRPHRGTIRINNKTMDEIDPKSFRNLFSMCSQETILFNNSLLEEIRIARPNATIGDVEEASRIAGLTPYINSIGKNLNTWIGDRGIHCSGGQRQMIALARAVLQNPEVLVLDEAISGIDMETGKTIWHNIRKKLPGCTILMISHHWYIIRHCSRILVLSNGRIVEDIAVNKVTNPEKFFSEFSLENTAY